jgi:hypothetical protein
MADPKSPTEMAIERIRLFFPLPDEEQIAVALTALFARHAGPPITEIKPDMTMGEVLDLAQDRLWTRPEFELMVESAGIEAFDEEFEHMTFREFVRYAASRKAESAQRITETNSR